MKTGKRNRIIWLALNSCLVLSVLLIGSVAALTAEVIRAGININDDYSFLYTDGNNNTFKCFQVSEGSNNVEIGWGGESPDSTPTSFTVPATVTNNGNTYNVIGIVQGGFRYCDFESITLPNNDKFTIIEEEAFAYCTNMTSFVFPYYVTEIADSTFIDCRAMENFFYYNSTGVVSVGNDTITSIGDNAFTSCISLVEFKCPTTLRTVETAAFQNCKGLTRFYFPSKTGSGESVNTITVGSYAFADCSNLMWVYFEENLTSVDKYAFADCNWDMVLHFGYDGTYPGDPVFTSHWRDKKIEDSTTDIYEIEENHIVILESNNYPGLKYTLQTDDIYLDCSKVGTTNRIKIFENTSSPKQKYAVIYQWDAPSTSYANYYNTTSHALEIPGTITHDGNTYPIKVINRETFANRTNEIESIKFNSGLIQICEKAFYKCTKIHTIDFSSCDTLIEVSNGIFNDKASNTSNTLVTSLTLPNSLEYIGKYAFYNFQKIQYLSFKTDATQPNNLKVLGGYCFARIGEFYKKGLIDVTLPCSLNDAVAKQANINFEEGDYNGINWAAIGPYCFGAGVNNQFSAVKRITMEACSHPEHAVLTYRCSLSPNAFNRAKYLTKFVANDNLFMVGNEVFKNCDSIREIFLTTTKAAASGKTFPWGTKVEAGNSFEQSIVSGDTTTKTDLVIYLDGQAPGQIDSYAASLNKSKWNAESSAAYNSDFGYNPTDNTNGFSRSCLPTFYDVDFDFENSILYWDLKNKRFLDEVPTEISDYNQGFVVLAKTKNSDEYTVVHYYTDNTNLSKEIDLTDITRTVDGVTENISSKITAIGPECFATHDKDRHRGYYFILPPNLKTISERAFFRKVNNNESKMVNSYEPTKYGVRIVTYKTAGGVIQPSNAAYAAAVADCNAKESSDTQRALMSGYCTLPNSVTRIERNAFYNNIFSEVNIGSNLAFLGKSAFFTMADTKDNVVRSKLTTITLGSTSIYNFISGGLYYVGDANKKTLLYQSQANGGTLTLDSGTKAVSMSACANTSYTKIALNSELTHIYGSAFQYNRFLTEVEIPSGSALKYIGAIAKNDEVIDDTLPFDNFDYRKRYDSDVRGTIESRNCAFADCQALTTLDFTKMTNIVKIGHGAFKNCTALQYCTPSGWSYSYYTYNASTDATSLLETKTDSVLDLSPCTNLRVIGRNAFENNSVIKYAHLPETNGLLSVARDKNDAPWQSGDNSGKFFNNSNIKYLVGDVADKACTAVSGTHASGDRWSNLWYNSSPVYYHATTDADLLTGSAAGSIRYYTEKPGATREYILFSDYSNAHAYFVAHPGA